MFPDLRDFRECRALQEKRETVDTWAQLDPLDSMDHADPMGLVGERAHLGCRAESVSPDLLERRVRTEKLETPGSLETPVWLALKAMSGRRETPAFLEQPDPQDQEGHQATTEPRATSAPMVFLETQGLLENLAQMEQMVYKGPRETLEKLEKQALQEPPESQVPRDLLVEGVTWAPQEKRGSKASREQRGQPGPRVRWGGPAQSDPRGYQAGTDQKVSEASQAPRVSTV